MSDGATDPRAAFLPSLERARREGVVVRAPGVLGLGAGGNLLRREPAAEWPLGAVQLVGERPGARASGGLVEVLDQTHVGGRLSVLELELRGAAVAFAREHAWPDALRVTLEARAAAGGYRDAPLAQRRTLAGYDYEDACESAVASRDGFLSAAAGGRCDAFVLPVTLLAFRGLGWRRTVALLAPRGRVQVVVPWAEQ